MKSMFLVFNQNFVVAPFSSLIYLSGCRSPETNKKSSFFNTTSSRKCKNKTTVWRFITQYIYGNSEAEKKQNLSLICVIYSSVYRKTLEKMENNLVYCFRQKKIDIKMSEKLRDCLPS